MIWRAIGRVILVPLGFALGAVAAVAVLLTLGFERFTHAAHGRQADARTWLDLLSLAKSTYGIATVATLVPAVLLVIVGEVARIRSSIYYILGAGAAMAALPLLAGAGAGGAGLPLAGGIWQIFATAGFAGGLAYWIVAGRKA